MAFKLAQCRDWSAVDVFDRAKPRLPWPYPEANVLVDQHFDEPDETASRRTDAILNRSQFQSRSAADLRTLRTRKAYTICNSIAAGSNAIPIRRCSRRFRSSA